MERKNGANLSFLPKKEFIKRISSECFKLDYSIEKELDKFDDEDILGIDIRVNSPAEVVSISKVGNIIDFLTQKLNEEGISQDQINKGFSVFE